MGDSIWSFLVSDRLRLDVQIVYERGVPTKFSLNLCGWIKGEWVPLVRYDNAHGPAHRHQFHPNGEDEIHDFLAMVPRTFVDKAQRDLNERAEYYLEEYERELSNRERGNLR